jgi:hypothetical protein
VTAAALNGTSSGPSNGNSTMDGTANGTGRGSGPVSGGSVETTLDQKQRDLQQLARNTELQ